MFKSAAGTAPMQPSKARKPRKKWPLSIKIFIALVLGILVGLCFMKNPGFATRYIQPFLLSSKSQAKVFECFIS